MRQRHLVIGLVYGLAVIAISPSSALPARSVALAASPLSWSAPVSVDSGANGFNGMSCASASLCVGIDNYGNVVTSADPIGGAATWSVAAIDPESLSGVSCPTVSLCVVVGTHRVLTSTDPTGGSGAWTSATLTAVGRALDVSCPSVSLCVAAGSVSNVATVFTSTNPTGGAGAWTATPVEGSVPQLTSISCPTVSLCVAGDLAGNVVTSTNPTGGAGAWTAVNVDAAPGGFGILGVSCPSVGLCVATDLAGNVVTSTNPTGGAGAWTLASGVDPDGLYRVSCPSATLCVAGSDSNSGNVVTSTNPTGGASAWAVTQIDGTNEMYPVSCPSTNLCVAGDSAGNVLIGTAGCVTPTLGPSGLPFAAATGSCPLIVNSSGDRGDKSTADGACDTGKTITRNKKEEPECTLRAAIEQADTLAGPQTITFDIPGGGKPEIKPASPLPDVEGTVKIDATTQPGGSVGLSPGDFQGFGAGLVLAGQGSDVRGMVVHGWVTGIHLLGTGGHHLSGNEIAFNSRYGVVVDSPGNQIGDAGVAGTCGSGCNQIYDNGHGRAPVDRGDVDVSADGSGSVIAGNFIGVLAADPTYNPEKFNWFSIPAGVVVETGASATIGPGNVVGYVQVGLLIEGTATVRGNLIGVTATGVPIGRMPRTDGVYEGQVGVWVRSGVGSEIGGPAPDDRNVISGWGPDPGRHADLDVFGHPIAGVIANGAQSTIQGNRIGTNPGGTAAVGNWEGIAVDKSAAGTGIVGNVISGNRFGVGNAFDGTAEIVGNLVGTDLTGTAAIPNRFGIASTGAVGGERPASSTGCVSPCNLISGNGTGVRARRIEGNFIGTTLDGTGDLGNGDGVVAYLGTTQVGGPSQATSSVCDRACNLIAHNGVGIGLGNFNSGGLGNGVIQGNVIRDNHEEGIRIQSDGPGTIGGDTPTLGNLITGNRRQGILIADDGSTGLTGGFAVTGNTITDNRLEGVLVASTNQTFGVTIRHNQIDTSGALGIDLSSEGGIGGPFGPFAGNGHETNTPFADGPNHLEAYPRIQKATLAGSTLQIEGHLPFFRASAGVGFRQIDLYGSTTCDPSGYGEGHDYLTTIQTSPLVNGRFKTTITPGPAHIDYLTATSTAPDGSTSEFSRCFRVKGP